MSLQVDMCILVWFSVSDVSSLSHDMNLVDLIDELGKVQKGWLLTHMLTSL